MKLFTKIKAYDKEEAKDGIIGFGIIRARDYDKERYGHLVFFSINIRRVFLKKLFIPF